MRGSAGRSFTGRRAERSASRDRIHQKKPGRGEPLPGVHDFRLSGRGVPGWRLVAAATAATAVIAVVAQALQAVEDTAQEALLLFAAGVTTTAGRRRGGADRSGGGTNRSGSGTDGSRSAALRSRSAALRGRGAALGSRGAALRSRSAALRSRSAALGSRGAALRSRSAALRSGGAAVVATVTEQTKQTSVSAIAANATDHQSGRQGDPLHSGHLLETFCETNVRNSWCCVWTVPTAESLGVRRSQGSFSNTIRCFGIRARERWGKRAPSTPARRSPPDLSVVTIVSSARANLFRPGRPFPWIRS